MNGSFINYYMAHVFQRNGSCVAFLLNKDIKQDATVEFQNATYQLPRQSASILSDCKHVAFDTAMICNSMFDLCYDAFGTSKEKKNLNIVKGHREKIVQNYWM